MARPGSPDPWAASPWSRPETIQGFTQSPPNAALLACAEIALHARGGDGRLLDVGCGAGRNAVPLARLGWRVLGVDLSQPMLAACAGRAGDVATSGRLDLVRASMDRLPVRSASVHFVVAHGIWNLARTGAEFRRGVREAARVLAPGGRLFVFTFSRHTLPPDAQPEPAESFVFTQFSGAPQCFLTEPQLLTELAAAGFAVAGDVPLRELNQPRAGCLSTVGTPVIYEAAFRRRAQGVA